VTPGDLIWNRFEFEREQMRLFDEGDLRHLLERQRQQLKCEIDSLENNYLLNANETDLVQHYSEKFSIEPLEILEDQVSATDRQEDIPAESFPFDFSVRSGQMYKKQVICYHIPFTGDRNLLKLTPSTRMLWSEDVVVQGNEIIFRVTNFSDDLASLKREYDEFLKRLKAQAGNSTTEVSRFNIALETEVKVAIGSRKAELLKRSNALASLGVPLKKSPNLSPTFAVPPPKKKVIFAKPIASDAAFAPEPTLDDKTYKEILKIIHDVGVEIERHPNIYQGTGEETLRDHFLMVLSPHFSSVTGETFNKSGKTDILIRHDGKNLFVAECGIWKGIKQFLGKIDQLLAYLTWRDSKTALICFVRNKEFMSVLELIRKETPSHINFVREEAKVGDAWFSYEFSLKDDRGRPVRLAVMCFHFPET
jgi:hypothetical protein